MHDVCVTCAKKCAVAMGANVLKFWLTLAKHEENYCYKLSQVAYNDIKWIKDKALWSQKIKNSLYHISLGNLWEKHIFQM